MVLNTRLIAIVIGVVLISAICFSCSSTAPLVITGSEPGSCCVDCPNSHWKFTDSSDAGRLYSLLDEAPTPIKRVKPDLFEVPKYYFYEDHDVCVHMFINQSGDVYKAIVVGDEHELRCFLALGAAKKWKFKPLERNGRMVECEVVVVFHFKKMS